MARKKKIGLYDIGRVPVTEVSNKSGYESNKELSARLRREEAEELAKKQKAIEDADPTRQAEKAMIAAETKVALQRSDRLTKICRNLATMEDFARKDPEMLIDDLGLSTTDTDQRATFEDTLQSFIERTLHSTTSEANRRFSLYVWVQVNNLKIAMTDDNLSVLLNRLISLGVFADGEVTLPRATKNQATVRLDEPTPTVADIEGMDTNTRENRAAVRDLVARLAAEEQVPLRDEWLYESLTKEFNFYITQEQWAWCWHIPNPRNPQDMGGWFQRNNKSPLDPRSYDECRRAAVANRIFPDRLLREDERLARDVEQSDTQDYTTRRDLNRRIAEQWGTKVLG
jgi:hypothetical protein